MDNKLKIMETEFTKLGFYFVLDRERRDEARVYLTDRWQDRDDIFAIVNFQNEDDDSCVDFYVDPVWKNGRIIWSGDGKVHRLKICEVDDAELAKRIRSAGELAMNIFRTFEVFHKKMEILQNDFNFLAAPERAY